MSQQLQQIIDTAWENRDNLGYAYRILRDGCCDGCSLGTSGMHDWTMEGIHLCAVRLQLLRLNTMPAMDWRLLEDVHSLRRMSNSKLRKLGRLSGDLMHTSGDSLEAYLAKQNRYTTLQAEALFARGERFSAARLVVSPIVRFIRFYILRGGFLDGVAGLVHISIGCFNSFSKYAKLRALEQAERGRGS